jgi:REP element-mobilizing transposase RayT
MCIQGHICLFGEVADDEVILNVYGRIVGDCWHDSPGHYPHIELDAFVVMPNHIHSIIVLVADDDTIVGAGLGPAPTGPTCAKRHGLQEIVRALKSFSARRINRHRKTPSTPVWQRNYYESVIRNESELNAIRQYIAYNPLNWGDDPDNPANVTPTML